MQSFSLVAPLNLCDRKYRLHQEQQRCPTAGNNSFYSRLPIFHSSHYAISSKLEVLQLNPYLMVISFISGPNFPSFDWAILQICIFTRYFTGMIPGEPWPLETSCRVLLFFYNFKSMVLKLWDCFPLKFVQASLH